MARSLIRVDLELDRIFVHDEGDGWGDAEPYLWTVFFKVDGDTVTVTDSLTLSGTPTIVTTPGSHDNLGISDADEGDTITIPSAIGEFSTILQPIPTPASLSNLVEDIGGVMGVVAVLMEEDNVTDDGAEAGHQALNNSVRDAIQEIINTRSFTNQDVTEEEIEAFTKAIESNIEDAIVDQQNFFENFWSWLNADDTIGTKVFIFKHDDLDPSTVTNFSHRWKNEGDWEIFGHISSTVLCPANALADFFAALQDDKASEETGQASPAGLVEVDNQQQLFRINPSLRPKPIIDLEPLRRFRDGDYRKMPGLANWFKLAERHSPRLIYMLAIDKELRKPASLLLEAAPQLVEKPETPVSDELLEYARQILLAFTRKAGRRARIDASRALEILPLLQGKTVGEAMKVLADIQPARHPNVAGDLRVRIPPPQAGPILSKTSQDRTQQSTDQ